jgi:predicted phosphodiesterase
MIRILYMSDLHLEMERWRLPVPGWPAFLARHRAIAAHPARGPILSDLGKIDLIVMAGDIHNGLRGIVYADQVAKFLNAPVVYLAGNHEFYHQQMDQLLPAFFTAAAHTKGRVHFLENALASFTFSGQRLNVLGCTLWTDYELHGHAPTAMRIAEGRMNDHLMIRYNNAPFVPETALVHHRQSRIWLHKTLSRLHKTEPGAKNLIVTHHAPSPSFLGKRTGAIAPAYGSDMLIEFAHLSPAAWIHGHTHHQHDSVEEGIRLVSAPRGYVAYDGAATLDYRPGLLEL